MTERARISSEHRDNRNQPAPEQPRTGNRKRSTARWCKGRPGVEHDYHPFDKVHWGFKWRYAKCSQCGREEWGHKAETILAAKRKL